MCPGSFFIIGKPSSEQKNNMWNPESIFTFWFLQAKACELSRNCETSTHW